MPQAERSNVIAMPSKAQAGPGHSTLRFYDDEFVFDTVSGMFYRMNPTACFILRALDAGVNSQDLPAQLQAHFALDHATAARDVELFLNDLAVLEPLNRLHPGNRVRT